MKSLTSIIEARAADDTLYHYTWFEAAASILASDTFKLTPSMGDSKEQRMQRGDRTYYLSTARHKLGGYTRDQDEGVVLNLDGNKLSQKYKISSVDFWGERLRLKDNLNDEAEDRVFSYESTIPNATSYIKSIHILMRVGALEGRKANYVRQLRYIWTLSKRNNIPIWWYDNKSNFLTQTNPVSIPVSILKATSKYWKPESTESPNEELKGVVELIKKPLTQPLSDNAKKITYAGVFGSNAKISVLGNSITREFHNHPHSDYATTITRYMRRNKLKTFQDLVVNLGEKWGET